MTNHTYGSSSEASCTALKAKTPEVRKLRTSLLFRKNCTVQQVLKLGMWPSQLTFTTYLRDVTHRFFFGNLHSSCGGSS